MHVGSKLSAIILSCALICLLGVSAPAVSFAGAPEIERGAWASSSAFGQSGLPRIRTASERASSRLRPGGLMDNLGLVRTLKELPFEPVSIGFRPRLPRDSDRAMGLVFVYRFHLL